MRKPFLIAGLICAGAISILLARPASTQTPFDAVERIEQAFANIETLRMRGDCAARDRRLHELGQFLTPLIGPTATAFRTEVKLEYSERLAEAARRRCPAGPPAATPAPPPPPPRTTTLDDLDTEHLLSCGARFEPLREQLIAAFDRAITRERVAAERARLADWRSRVLARKYRPCSPPPPAGPAPAQEVRTLADQLNAACGDQWSVLRLRMLAALDKAIAVEGNAGRIRDYQAARTTLLRRDPPPCEKQSDPRTLYERAFYAAEIATARAEDARIAGDCVKFRASIDQARRHARAMAASGHRPAVRLDVDTRINQTAARPCPPRPRTLDDVRKAPACANTFNNHRDARLPMRCRCNGIEQYLSTYGSGPYAQNSAICNAAVHAGVLPRNGVGVVLLSPVPGLVKIEGSERNGISSMSFFRELPAFTVRAAP